MFYPNHQSRDLNYLSMSELKLRFLIIVYPTHGTRSNKRPSHRFPTDHVPLFPCKVPCLWDKLASSVFETDLRTEPVNAAQSTV